MRSAIVALVFALGAVAVTASLAQAAAFAVDAERIAGPSRYETATEIAAKYVQAVEGGTGAREVDTVILTSGRNDHLGYVLATPALANRHDAPVLLTKPEDLPSTVRRFLQRHDIGRVIIVGGTKVVSNAVQQEVDGLSGVSVSRIAGSDVYTTAVEVAAQSGQTKGVPGAFPREGRTALLGTGEALADALAAGPLAYRGHHPILLTPGKLLADEVVEYLTDSNTQHVVVLGGTAAVSGSVERRVQELGIQTSRWAGNDRYQTAVEVAATLLGSRSPQSCFTGAEVGLAYAWRSPDAIVSAPYLGELCAPLLLTDRDTLPAAVREFLASNEYVTGDAKGDLNITVFGGTAAIGASTMNAALNAAGLTTIGARMSVTEGACHFAVEFNAAVRTGDATDITNYLIDGAALRRGQAQVETSGGSSAQSATVVLAGGRYYGGATVPTQCSSPLRSGQRVGIVGGEIRSATDRRIVGPAEIFVGNDAIRPRLIITAAQNADTVWIDATEPIQGAFGTSTVAVEFFRGGLDAPVYQLATPSPGASKFAVTVPSSLLSVGNLSLQPGDRVTIHADEIEDLAGNRNRRASLTVVADTRGPQLSRVTVTEPTQQAPAQASVNGLDSNGAQQIGALQIEARAGTLVEGAAGNEWTLDVEVLSRRRGTWSSTQGSSVEVSTRLSTVVIQVLRDWSLGYLKSDLNRDPAFSKLFVAEVIAGRDSLAPVGTGGPVQFRDGLSSVDLTVYWTEPVQDCGTGPYAVDPRGIEIDVNADGVIDFALDGTVLDAASDLQFIADRSRFSSLVAGRAACAEEAATPNQGTLVARVMSSGIDKLPTTSSDIYARPRAAHDLSGNPNVVQLAIALRPV